MRFSIAASLALAGAALSLSACKTAEQLAAEAAAAEAAAIEVRRQQILAELETETAPSPLAHKAALYGQRRGENDRIASASLTDSESLTGVTDMAVRYRPDDLAEGWTAFAALNAASNEAFRDGVIDMAARKGRHAIIADLLSSPTLAASFSGAGDAQAGVLNLASRERARLYGAGERFKGFSYALQDERWAQRSIPDAGGRADTLKAVASRTVAVSDDMVAKTQLYAQETVTQTRAFASLSADIPASGRSLSVGGGQMDKVLTLAALEALGATDELAEGDLEHLASYKAGSRCVYTVQLNMYQCVAAAKFQYEEAFCVSEHALKEMGDCLTSLR